MKQNIGPLDRAARIVLGLVLIIGAATQMIGWWGWIGIVPLITAAVGNCPLYQLLGICTKAENKH